MPAIVTMHKAEGNALRLQASRDRCANAQKLPLPSRRTLCESLTRRARMMTDNHRVMHEFLYR